MLIFKKMSAVTRLINLSIILTVAFITSSTPSLAFEPGLPFASNDEAVPLPEYERRQPEERLTVFGDDLMGDQIDFSTGALSFNQVDVDLPGNFDLPVRVERKRSMGDLYQRGVDVDFADWELVVPKISALTTQTGEWLNAGARCSATFKQSFPTFRPGSVALEPAAYQNGIKMEAPAVGSRQLLYTTARSTFANIQNLTPQFPATAKFVTTDNWYFTCIQASDGGQGFLGHAPNGDKYVFDRVIKRAANDQSYSFGGRSAADRNRVMLMATVITDINGNSVEYNYDNLDRLTQISASDGRAILFSYVGNGLLIDKVKVSGTNREWKYSYRKTDFVEPQWNVLGGSVRFSQVLETVTQPDTNRWTYDLDGMFATPKPAVTCGDRPYTLQVTHPYGTVGNFTIIPYRYRAADISTRREYPECPDADGKTFLNAGRTLPPLEIAHVRAIALASKTLIESDQTRIWRFRYGVNAADRVNTTLVTDPGGYSTRYENYWSQLSTDQHLEGKLKRSIRYDKTGTKALTTTNVEYLSEAYIGSPEFITRLTPSPSINVRQVKQTILQDSESFTTEMTYNTNFSSPDYSYGNPVRTSVYSSVPASTAPRITEIEYEHNKGSWILGLSKKMTQNGREISSYTYNNKGQLTQQKRFGDIVGNYTYHTDGNLKQHKDALNRTHTLENYYRGQAQKITRPDGNKVYATYDVNGWLTSVTNARGYKTDYSYNNAGWLTKIEPPAPWVDTNISYSNIGSGTVQTNTSGPRRTTITNDSMHRPILIRTQSLSGGGRNSYVKTRYDSLGRSIFTSRPSTTSNPTNGTEVTYDGLGRVIKTRETVAPFATTTTEYLSGNRVRVTDAEGNVTTTTRSGYGSPNDGNVTLIEQPEGINTEMTYDLFGNLLTARQYGSSGGYNVNQTQRWVYDDELRLCRKHTPESGSTLYGYDAVDNVIATYKGQPFAANCNLPSGTDRIISEYDSLNRPKEVEYIGADNRRDYSLEYRYDENSNLKDISKYGLGRDINHFYSYDSADNLIREAIQSEEIVGIQTFYEDGELQEEDDQLSLNATYTYDANGYMTAMRTPLGRNISYTNNGLGQVTHVSAGGAYFDDATLTVSADNTIYNVDGSLHRIRYGNNRTTWYGQNSRQLLSRLLVNGNGQGTFIDRRYTHDGLGRITEDLDSLSGAETRRYTYDGVSRLKTASGPWGAGSYQYDALGNIRDKSLGSRRVRMFYNGINRLTAIKDSAGPGNNKWQRVTYDNYGNVTDNGRRQYGNTSIILDPSRVEIGYGGVFERPISMSGGVTASYSYDGNNRRVYQKIDGEETLTFYSQSGAILLRATLDPNIRRDPSLDINRPLAYTDYIRAGGKTIARVERREGDTAETVTYVHQNHLGSPIATTDESGNVLWRESYTPFGEKWASDGDNDDNVSFTGHIHDSKSNLTYMQARFYDPTIGRFLSVDPVGFLETGNPSFFNRYTYAFNDPVNMIDPNGEETTCSSGNSVCVTKVDSTQAPNGRDPSVATNANDSNMRSNDATGTPALDQAASEVAGIVNQRRGNERAFRMDVSEGEEGEIVTTTEIETTSSSPNHAAFKPSEVSGADGFLHTEPTNANTGVPGTGDGAVPQRFGIPNYQAFGKRVNANEISGGVHQIRPVNHRSRTGLRRRANDHQKK